MRIGNIFMVEGGFLVVLGALVRFAPGLFTWFGRLPGDIRAESNNSRLFIPITSMILVSVAATVIINLIAGFFRDR